MEIPVELSPSVKRALKRLSMGDLTCGEMEAYLTDPRRSVSFSPEIAQRTVCLLVEEGFLDDKRYLRLFVKHLDEKCCGPRRIRQELIRRRFPPRFVEAVLDRKVDYTRRAKTFLQKKYGAAPLSLTPSEKKKYQDALIRYGYDYAAASSAISEYMRGEDF